MFQGLSAFPLTPIRGGEPDLAAAERLIASIAAAGVDSIGALGSTGAYPYLDRTQRRELARVAVAAAGELPVIVGVGAIGTAGVMHHIDDAMDAGAAGILLPPLTYQALSSAEVFGLYDDVTSRFEVPVVVYDNPATTKFTFTPELLADIAQLPHIASIKLSPLGLGTERARELVSGLRARVPAHVTLGVSGDAVAAAGLLAGCDAWYSVLAGVFPVTCARIAAAARARDDDTARALSAELQPVWELFATLGSFRTVAAIATLTGVLERDAVYAPVRPLRGADREAVEMALAAIGRRT